MDKQSKAPTAAVEDDALKVFVRSSAEELEPSDLNLVAGGIGTCIVPLG